MTVTTALTVTIPQTVAMELLAKAGITPTVVTDRKGREAVRWRIPEEAAQLVGFDMSWDADEALVAALEIIAVADEPDMLTWRA